MVGEKRTLSFGITGEFITQITREWFYSGEKSIGKIMEILADSMTGTDTPEAQIRRYAEDILMGRAALKGNTADGTYHLEIYGAGEEEELPGNMNIWKIPWSKKILKSELDRMKMNTGNAAGRNGKTQGHSENAAHGMRTSLYMKTVIYSWMVKLRRSKKNGAIRWKNCTKAICLI